MLAIAGGKGGCGKTTTALGLAVALAPLVDAVPTVVGADRDVPDLHLLAGVSEEPNLADLRGGPPTTSVGHDPPTFPGITVVPAPAASLPSGRFHAALDDLTTRTSPTLVDCPAGAGGEAIVPLRIADSVLVVTTLSPSSLRDATKTAAIARRLDVRVLGAVPTSVRAWAMDSDQQGHDQLRPAVRRRVEYLLETPVIGWVPEVEETGRAVLDQPVVRASYARLASSLCRGENLTRLARNTR